MKKKQNYTEYLRKSFFQYAMVLFVSMALLVVGFFVFDYVTFVHRENANANQRVSSLFGEEYARYLNNSISLSGMPEMRNLLKDNSADARAYVSRALYDFSNDGTIRSRFLVMDASGSVLLSNFTKTNQQVFADSLFAKRVLSRLDGAHPETLTLLCDADFGGGQRCSYCFARPLSDAEGRIAGSLFLLMRDEDLSALAQGMSEELLLLDHYDNVVFSSLLLPSDPGDKLPTRRLSQDIRENGVYTINGVRMYARLTHLEEGNLDIITLTSIDSRLHMYRVAGIFFLLTLIVLGILMFLMARLYTGINERSVTNLMRDLEIKNLEERFNPHFVFNVMESVYFQIDENPKKAQEMLLAFSTLMRYSVNQDESRVRLETDIDYLNDYLMLQKIRYNNLLTYRFRIPDELLDCMVPKLLMQPVIENSIRHGYVKDQPLHIEIEAAQEGDTLLFTITDNGKGITEERLKEIRNSFDEEVGEETIRHFGLYNVEKVLSMLYGDRFGLTIKSTPGTGTVVRLAMPYETEEEDV